MKVFQDLFTRQAFLTRMGALAVYGPSLSPHLALVGVAQDAHNWQKLQSTTRPRDVRGVSLFFRSSTCTPCCTRTSWAAWLPRALKALCWRPTGFSRSSTIGLAIFHIRLGCRGVNNACAAMGSFPGPDPALSHLPVF